VVLGLIIPDFYLARASSGAWVFFFERLQFFFKSVLLLVMMWLVVLIGADLEKIKVIVASLCFNIQNAAFYRWIMLLPYRCMRCCLCNASKLLTLCCLIWKMLLALSAACLDTKESWNQSSSRFLWHVGLKMVTGLNLHALIFVQDRHVSLMLCLSVTPWCYLLALRMMSVYVDRFKPGPGKKIKLVLHVCWL
jgi:hypothetical protein